MYFMGDSATGLRERRREATASRLTALARELTAAGGLSGFTIEELCERADVSRRTFFNYFSSKEDAVLGRSARLDDSALEAAFVVGREAGPAGLSPFLLDDLASLSVQRWARLGFDRDALRGIAAAFAREPRLVARMVELSIRDEEADIELVEHRENLAPGDLRAAAAVQIIGALARASAREFLDPANCDPYARILARRLAATRQLDAFSPPSDESALRETAEQRKPIGHRETTGQTATTGNAKA